MVSPSARRPSRPPRDRVRAGNKAEMTGAQSLSRRHDVQRSPDVAVTPQRSLHDVKMPRKRTVRRHGEQYGRQHGGSTEGSTQDARRRGTRKAAWKAVPKT